MKEELRKRYVQIVRDVYEAINVLTETDKDAALRVSAYFDFNLGSPLALLEGAIAGAWKKPERRDLWLSMVEAFRLDTFGTDYELKYLPFIITQEIFRSLIEKPTADMEKDGGQGANVCLRSHCSIPQK